MNNLVPAEIPVTPEAASLLRDSARAERVGRLVSEMLSPTRPETDPVAHLIRELKAEVKTSGLTDADIDAELAAYNAERRI